MAGPHLQKIPGIDAAEMIAGRYRIEKVLGAGSSGFVVAARHVHQRRPVTLKLLPRTTPSRERVIEHHLAAARRAAALSGPHIARIVDTGVADDGTPFIATEHLDGQSLADELDARGPISAAQAVRWIMQACEALAEAHAAGIVHGDLKPQNLFLVGEPPAPGEPDARILKVLDFGMATPVDEKTEETSPWLSSPAYLSPEQIREPDEIDARTDIWALGVILHQLVANDLPFSAETVSGMLVSVACDKPALLACADVPFELARVVQSCVGKTREERPKDVTELARALAPFAGADGVPLLARVEAAFSARPAVAAAADACASRPSTLPSRQGRTAWRKPVDDAERRRVWRRRGAIATVVGVGIVGLVGLLSPDRQRTGHRDGPPSVEDLGFHDDDELAPLAKALPVVTVESLPPAPPEPPPVAAPAPATRAAPKPVVVAPRPSPARSGNEALRGALRAPSPAPKTRPTLSVREDPYGKPTPPPRPAAPRQVTVFERRK